MTGVPQPDSQYPRTRRPAASPHHFTVGGAVPALPHSEALRPGSLSHRLLHSEHASAARNAPLRSEMLHRMQRTHGNRAVQRYLSASGSTSSLAVQRSPLDDFYRMMGIPTDDDDLQGEEAGTARKGRTAASKTATALREGSKALSATGRGVSAAEETLRLERIFQIPGGVEAAEDALKSAKGAQEGSWINRNLGSESKVGKGLRGSNYALQFWENLTKGQGLDEALVGAGAGGWMNNNITRQLFDKTSFMHKPLMGGGGSGPVGRNMGWIDTAVNLGNAGLKLLGVPEEVTAWTQAAADATPSSFATSAASNAARGLWNTGKGIFTGDWDALEEQGQSIVQGKEGAPLQGYGMAVELFTGDHDKMLEESRSGKRGYLAQLGTRIGKWARGGEYDEWDAEREGGPAARERFLKMQAARPMREATVARERAQQEKKDQAEKAAFDKEMAAISAQIEKGPAIPGNMLGTPGDPLSSRAILAGASQTNTEEEEGEELPYVPMALPAGRR